jgi:hypothetical protein
MIIVKTVKIFDSIFILSSYNWINSNIIDKNLNHLYHCKVNQEIIASFSSLQKIKIILFAKAEQILPKLTFKL